MYKFFTYTLSILLLGILFFSPAIGQLPYEVERTEFSNSVLDEFNPLLLDDTLLFYSNQQHELFIRYVGSNNQRLFNLFYVEFDSEGKASNPEVFSHQFATPDENSPFTFSPDGKIIVYTRQLVAERKKNIILESDAAYGLFFAERKDGNWQEILEFPYNSTSYSITTASYSPDGKYIYFASDMPGGIGGMDLYRSEWKDSEWSEPENLGEPINSNRDESYPFISESGILFFASDGHDGLGERDIFLSKEKEDGWILPVHLREPLNSKEDDFAFITDADFRSGYFSSNREISEDIYHFATITPQLFDCDSMLENNYCFEFWDERVEGIESIPVVYEWEFSDGHRERGLSVEHCMPGPGTYWAKLNIIDNQTSNTFFTQSELEFTLNDYEQAYIGSQSVGLVKESVDFDANKSYLPGIDVERYLWEFGDDSYGSGPEVSHTFRKTGNYDVKLGVEIITDSGAVEIYCVKKHVQIVKDEMELAAVLSGLDVELSSINDSESENNKYQQDFSVFDVDPEEEVFRVEVLESEDKILLDDTIFDPLRVDHEIKEFYLPDDSVYSYTIGEFDDLLSTYDLYNDVVEKGFNSARVQTFVLAALPTAIIEKINREFAEIADANFEFDKAEISEVSYGVLNMVVEIMKEHPDLAMEITAHTDNVGSFEYNMDLSQRRAESIVNYLISKGVDRIRLIAKGYGESKPIESNDTAEGRRMNRRVEFIILNEQ